MQFHSDEYLLLSRRGSVPLSRTRPVRPPAPVITPAGQADPRRGHRDVLARRAAAIRAVRGGLRATWTAFGSGSAEL